VIRLENASIVVMHRNMLQSHITYLSNPDNLGLLQQFGSVVNILLEQPTRCNEVSTDDLYKCLQCD